MFNCKKIITVAAIAVIACAAFGQGQGRRGFGFGQQTGATLLRRPDVQADLKLTDDQKTKISDLVQGMRPKMQEIFQNDQGDQAKMQADMKAMQDDMTKQANAILTADQQTRLKQIGYQLAGNGAAAMPDVQATLGLTDDQKAKIAELQKTAMEANASVMDKARNNEIDRAEVGPAMRKNADALNEGIGKILTDAQKAKLKELGGPTFTPNPPPGG